MRFSIALATLLLGLTACDQSTELSNEPSPFDRFEDREPPTGPAPNQVGEAAGRNQSRAFARCGDKRIKRGTCVVDGDTLWLDGTKIRVADIDTPETGQPQCESEKDLGERATSRFVELLNEGPFELRPGGSRDTDQYGRKLRILVRENRSIGKQLVEEGLARTWTGRREPWC